MKECEFETVLLTSQSSLWADSRMLSLQVHVHSIRNILTTKLNNNTLQLMFQK